MRVYVPSLTQSPTICHGESSGAKKKIVLTNKDLEPEHVAYDGSVENVEKDREVVQCPKWERKKTEKIPLQNMRMINSSKL